MGGGRRGPGKVLETASFRLFCSREQTDGSEGFCVRSHFWQLWRSGGRGGRGDGRLGGANPLFAPFLSFAPLLSFARARKRTAWRGSAPLLARAGGARESITERASGARDARAPPPAQPPKCLRPNLRSNLRSNLQSNPLSGWGEGRPRPAARAAPPPSSAIAGSFCRPL